MPPIPDWSSAHPIIVHFPVALLMVAPVLIIAAILARKSWRPLAVAAFIVLLMGTAGAVLATASGEAGEGAAKAIPAAKATLERHEELGELTRNTFIALTLVFGIFLGAMGASARIGRRVFVLGSVTFLVPYLAATVLLARTAHEGGLLVHQHGVHASIAGSPRAADLPSRARHDDD
jgi:uncharacterized membrane protein